MRALLAAILVLGVGCGTGVAPAVGEPGSLCDVTFPSAQARLEAAPIVFDLQQHTSLGSFTARRMLFNAEPTAIPLTVESGRLVASATSNEAGFSLTVSEYQARLADVVFSRSLLPPSGLTLTQVWFKARGPVSLPVRWLGSGTVGVAAGLVPIEIHSALRTTSGEPSPLDVGVLPAVPMEVVVQRVEGGVLLLSAKARLDGTLWSWARLFELGDLSFTAEANEEGALIELPGVATNVNGQLR